MIRNWEILKSHFRINNTGLVTSTWTSDKWNLTTLLIIFLHRAGIILSLTFSSFWLICERTIRHHKVCNFVGKRFPFAVEDMSDSWCWQLIVLTDQMDTGSVFYSEIASSSYISCLWTRILPYLWTWICSTYAGPCTRWHLPGTPISSFEEHHYRYYLMVLFIFLITSENNMKLLKVGVLYPLLFTMHSVLFNI